MLVEYWELTIFTHNILAIDSVFWYRESVEINKQILKGYLYEIKGSWRLSEVVIPFRRQDFDRVFCIWHM